jgi:hypothetical protein
MRAKLLIAAVAVLMSGVGAAVARADQPPLDLAGQPFYFSATCTGIGDVILFNQSLARRAGLVVVEGEGAVVVPSFINPNARANGTCTFTGGGFSIDEIEPLDNPVTLDVLIVP